MIHFAEEVQQIISELQVQAKQDTWFVIILHELTTFNTQQIFLFLPLSPGWSTHFQVSQLSLGATVWFYSCLNKNGMTSQHLFFQPLIIGFPSLFRDGHHSDPVLLLEPELHELQLALLSRFDPEHVLSFLQTSPHYRLEEAALVRSALFLIVYSIYIYIYIHTLYMYSVIICSWDESVCVSL